MKKSSGPKTSMNMSESDSLFSENEKFEFEYSGFILAVFWIGGPILILLPVYLFYQDGLNKEYEPLSAFLLFLLGIWVLHGGWRALGRVIFTKEGVSYIRFGRTTFISYLDIREIRNRYWMKSLKIVCSNEVIFIEKQINGYMLAYEILFEKARDKLEMGRQKSLSMPIVAQTVFRHYLWFGFMCVGSSIFIGWELWQETFNLMIMVIFSFGLLAGAYLIYKTYMKYEIDSTGILIKGVVSRVAIPKNHILHLDLLRNYKIEDDPCFEIHIDYLDMPVENAPDDAEVYTEVISCWINTCVEALYELIVREYDFDRDSH